ncbi:Hypothetical Protein CTN_0717 [Thermotoga neapolitana DSM 4359]|uniref:Uncharacterized protein n=1 Tax=Thermotoga neapolitana (strain ATCC 49049 / DSM 4359 / NBRC 107923 / NS-E) TaxID=309803 RepID=B9K7G0_THENN|nr:Hypothetical Protein CTN_0717 [Thermotoga neapolitana DSM 4359]
MIRFKEIVIQSQVRIPNFLRSRRERATSLEGSGRSFF